MTKVTDEQRQLRISKARTKLILDHPFLGTIALGLKIIIDEKLNPPTAATNGEVIIFHPEFMDGLNDDELLFVTAHEVYHPMFDHCTRRGDRDPLKWNMAADYVINRLLILDSIGKQPIGILDDPALYAKGDGITDTIYRIMPDPPKSNQPGQGGRGSSMDNCQDATGNKDEIEQEWKQKVAQAAAAAKMAGKLSDNQARFVNDLLNPKVDWREVLQRFVVKCRSDMRSYSRPNRRFMDDDFIRPSVSGETMGDMVVAIDCSGSITPDLLTQFATEITSIKEDVRPRTIHVVYFDSVVCHHDTFGREDQLAINMHGGGGTAFSPIFRFIYDQDINPACCVVLTDLCCSDFGAEPEYPVLWVTTEKGNAPWGEITEMSWT